MLYWKSQLDHIGLFSTHLRLRWNFQYNIFEVIGLPQFNLPPVAYPEAMIVENPHAEVKWFFMLPGEITCCLTFSKSISKDLFIISLPPSCGHSMVWQLLQQWVEINYEGELSFCNLFVRSNTQSWIKQSWFSFSRNRLQNWVSFKNSNRQKWQYNVLFSSNL